MSFIKLAIIFTLLNLLNNHNFAKENMTIPIIPTPKSFITEKGDYTFPKSSTVTFKGDDKTKLQYSVDKLSESLGDYITTIKLSDNGKADLNLEIIDKAEVKNVPADLVNEYYRLTINKEGISIKSPSYRGVYYGIVTLIQMIERTDNNLPFSKIEDYPDMKIRGISDDISRGQVSTLENFKKIIEFIARYKMNTFMPYIEDVIELKSFPTIGVNRGALTRQEIKELHIFAEKHFVEIIPIFQTLGHYENLLLQKEFVKYADFPGAASLDVSNPEIYVFLETMLKEVFELFPSEYFNMGADESYDVGLGNSKELVDSTSLAKAHLEHYKKVYAICKKYNKKVMMYSDILLHHPEIIDGLPKDIIPVDWHYRPQEEYTSTKKFMDAGFEYIVSPSVWNFQSPFPTYFNALPNIEYITKEGIKYNSIGMINSNWGDYGAETIKELIYYGYAYSAATSWNIKADDLNRFNINFFTDFFNAPNSQIDVFYNIISAQLNQYLWHDAWRHPALVPRTINWWESGAARITKYNWMLNSIPLLYQSIGTAKKVAKRNLDHLDILTFMTKFNEWYVLKAQTSDLINKKLNNSSTDDALIIALIDRNIKTIKELKSEYRNIWLKYYKLDNLNMIEDKMDRLSAYFNETKDAIQNGSLKSPVIESKWVYYLTSKDTLYRNVKFKKTFNISGEIKSADLQLMGDTYVKLFVNGVFIDEIFARRSLSLLVDYKRFLTVDVAKYLKTGENTIEVEASNFNKGANAGMNLISEIKTSTGNIKLISDESWQVTDLESKKGDYKNSVLKDYPFVITAPNFETKRTSWIER